MKGPTVESIFHYACFNLALKPFLNRPGDGRMQPKIPASDFAWALVLGALLRLNPKRAVARSCSGPLERGTRHFHRSGQRESPHDGEQDQAPALNRFQPLRD